MAGLAQAGPLNGSFDSATIGDDGGNWVEFQHNDMGWRTDGDTMDDWAEWKARTDPLDPDSFLYGEIATTPARDLDLLMHTVAGRRYALDTTTNLVMQPFYPLLEGTDSFCDLARYADGGCGRSGWRWDLG